MESMHVMDFIAGLRRDIVLDFHVIRTSVEAQTLPAALDTVPSTTRAEVGCNNHCWLS